MKNLTETVSCANDSDRSKWLETTAAMHQHDQNTEGEPGYCEASEADWRLQPDFPLCLLTHLNNDWISWFKDEVAWDESLGGVRQWKRLLTEDIQEEVIVFVRDDRAYLWDGCHRVAAAISSGKESIRAIVGEPHTDFNGIGANSR
jgi:hypothetical protein